jgi:hypothetical protein
LKKYIDMPSGPGAMWGRALEIADAIPSSVIVWDEEFFSKVMKLRDD